MKKYAVVSYNAPEDRLELNIVNMETGEKDFILSYPFELGKDQNDGEEKELINYKFFREVIKWNEWHKLPIIWR